MPRERARAVPRQTSREGEQLRDAGEQGRRSRESSITEGRLHRVELAAMTEVDLRHQLEHMPRGWLWGGAVSSGAIIAPREVSRSREILRIANDGPNAMTIDVWVF